MTDHASRITHHASRITHHALLTIAVLLLIGCASPTPSPPTRTPAPPPGARGPYLQSVTPHSVWVVWNTEEPVVGRVEYGPTGALGDLVEGDGPRRRHEVELVGLEPDTTYFYRVDGGPLYRFRTAPDSDEAAFRLAVLGDTQTYHETHAVIAAQIAAAAPDLIVHTGDLVGDGWDVVQWDEFFAVAAPMLHNAPFYPVLGNHEKNDPLYFDAFVLPGNERWYAFDYGPVRFVMLQIDGRAHAGPDSEQVAWLEQEMVANERPWLFVTFHMAPYTSQGEAFDEIARRNTLVPLFERYGVDVVLNGHHHGYERIRVNDVTYVVTGGGGGPLYEFTEPEPGSQVTVSAHHFVLFDVDGCRLDATAIDVDGAVIDTFSLSVPPCPPPGED